MVDAAGAAIWFCILSPKSCAAWRPRLSAILCQYQMAGEGAGLVVPGPDGGAFGAGVDILESDYPADNLMPDGRNTRDRNFSPSCLVPNLVPAVSRPS